MYDLPDLNKYVQVRPGLYRCTIIWPVATGVNVPVSTFLVRGNAIPGTNEAAHEWLLIDSGDPTQPEKLIHAVSEVLAHEKDTLRYICITHGHLDHTGAAPLLLAKYPEAKAVIHAEEKPFICGGRSFRTVTSDTWTFTLLKYFSHETKVILPEDRVITLRDGDQWEFDHVLKFVETHGHTPGSASFLHIPSRSIMVGDAVMNIAANPVFSRIPCISGPMVMSTCHWGNAMKAIDKILTYREEVDTVFPAHDYNPDGVHIDKVHEFHHPETHL
ncbi:hypothetical protein BGZ83_000765 [Gryganskiella cystojenkinii]|nr:hypothetical protein BGZ83_000765 [Gryganskiella cystojenkinii]